MVREIPFLYECHVLVLFLKPTRFVDVTCHHLTEGIVYELTMVLFVVISIVAAHHHDLYLHSCLYNTSFQRALNILTLTFVR